MQGWGEDRTKGDISVEIKSLILCFDSIGGNMIGWFIDLIIQSLFFFYFYLSSATCSRAEPNSFEGHTSGQMAAEEFSLGKLFQKH